jgi:chlorophyll synthase
MVTQLASDAWLDPELVTTFLAVAFVATCGGVIYNIATANDAEANYIQNIEAKNETTNVGSDKSRQLLGIKGALDDEVPLWKIRVQLTKPVTWVPLIWGVACGAAASGNFHWWNPFTIGQPGHIPLNLALSDYAKALTAMFMSGPLLTGYTQTINDWYDREIDAINEPYRPIPSGRITGPQVIAQIWVLLLAGVGVAAGLDYAAGHWFDGFSGVFLGPVQIPPIVANALFGAFVAYIYSAPPLKLKQSGWIGNYALGASYIALPWWCGQSLFGELNTEVMVLSVLYSLAGLGIAIVNDFKSIEGDRDMGLMSLPVQFGIEKAKWICAGTIDATQLAVALYLAYIGETNYAITLFGLVAPQMFFQLKFFLKNPLEFDVKYQASAQPFLVFGILCTALAMGHHQLVASTAAMM